MYSMQNSLLANIQNKYGECLWAWGTGQFLKSLKFTTSGVCLKKTSICKGVPMNAVICKGVCQIVGI